MVAITNIQKIFQVPTSFTHEMKKYAAQLIVQKIKNNTKKGISADGSPFPKYSKSYKESLDFENAEKTSKVNLELTGDMIASLDVISIDKASVTIGYSKDSEFAGQVEGNQIGSYGQDSGNSKVARPFIGLPSSELKDILDRVQLEMSTPESQFEVSTTINKQERLVNSILKALFR